MSKQIDLSGKTILISRTDSIGDVVLTLPVCLWIKENFENTQVIFLGNVYTKPVLNCLSAIDKILCWDDFEALPPAMREEKLKAEKIDVCLHVFPKKEIAALVKKVKIEHRIGTSHRAFHLLTCNTRVNFTRKNSPFHEAQLNFNLCKPFGLEELPSVNYLSEVMFNGFKPTDEALPEKYASLKNAIILHPKSQGSALEWPIENYLTLAENLLAQGETIVFSGTEKEGLLFREKLPKHANSIDLTGKLNLAAFICFIAQSKALVACSTGPYHLAGILGIKAIGLFSSRKPIHPGRWKALGSQSVALEFDPSCSVCSKGKSCNCIQKIPVEKVLETLIKN